MTVRELVALLQAHPHQDDLVVLAGCDCENAMGPPDGWEHLRRQEVGYDTIPTYPEVAQLVLQVGPSWTAGGKDEILRVRAIQDAAQ